MVSLLKNGGRMENPRRVTLLGSFGVTGRDGRPIQLRLRKDRALLAWLATAPQQSRPRGTAIGLLWGDSDVRHAAASLSQALYSLRRDLSDGGQDLIIADTETIRFVPGSISTDVSAFEELARWRDPDSLKQAEALYAGDFLEGFEPPTQDFEDWMQTERRRLRELATDVLVALLEHAGEAKLADLANRLLGIDPYNEAALRALMSHHAERGRTARAVAAYDNFRRRLADDLGVEPDPTTEMMRETILNGGKDAKTAELTPTAGVRPAVPHGPAGRGMHGLLSAGVAFAISIGATALYLEDWFRHDPDVSIAAESSIPSIAIAPFSGDTNSKSALLAQGLTNDLTTSLVQLPDIFVSAGQVGAENAVGDVTNRKIAEQLGVRYLLRGDVQTSGEQLRISARLIDTVSDVYVWSAQHERPVDDLFAIQDDLVLRIASDLRGQLDEGERLRQTRDTENLASWLASTKAYGEFLKFAPSSNAAARVLWEEALFLDSDRAVPHAGIAFTHYQDALRGWSADKDGSISKGIGHAGTALKRDPELPLAYQALGALKILQGDAEAGLGLRRKAVALAPNDFSAVGGLASILAGMGETDEAVELFRHAIQLNPEPPLWVLIWFGNALQADGQAEEASRWLERAIERNPKLAHVHALLSAVYSEIERENDAAASRRQALALEPGLTSRSLAEALSMPDMAFRTRMEELFAQAGFPE